LKLVLFRQDGGTPTTSKPDWRLQFDWRRETNTWPVTVSILILGLY
jgi:hypothetical protein